MRNCPRALRKQWRMVRSWGKMSACETIMTRTSCMSLSESDRSAYVMVEKVRPLYAKGPLAAGQGSVCNIKRSAREPQRSACGEKGRTRSDPDQKSPLGSLRIKTTVRA